MRKVLLPVLLTFMLLAMLGCGSSDNHDGDLQAPIDSDAAAGEDVLKIAQQFNTAGFSDIQLEGNGKLIIGLLHSKGEVQEVLVKGSARYRTSDWFAPDTPIVIRYYSHEEESASLDDYLAAQKKAEEEAEKKAQEEAEAEAKRKAEEEARRAEEKAAAEKAAKEEEERLKKEEEERKLAEEAAKAEQDKLNSFIGQPLRDIYQNLLSEGINVKLLHETTGADMTPSIQDAIEHENEPGNTEFINDWIIRKARTSEDGSYELTIIPGSILAEQEHSEAVRTALESKLDPAFAWQAVEAYGEAQFPEGFKLHWIMGRLAEEARDENTWFLKAYCDVTIGGVKASDLNCEATVTGTDDNPHVETFNVY